MEKNILRRLSDSGSPCHVLQVVFAHLAHTRHQAGDDLTKLLAELFCGDCRVFQDIMQQPGGQSCGIHTL